MSCGLLIGYCVWFTIVTLSTWFVRLESGEVAFDPVLQMARFPVEIYPARARSFLTFALPVAFLTTFPAQAYSAKLMGEYSLWRLGLPALRCFCDARFSILRCVFTAALICEKQSRVQKCCNITTKNATNKITLIKISMATVFSSRMGGRAEPMPGAYRVLEVKTVGALGSTKSVLCNA